MKHAFGINSRLLDLRVRGRGAYDLKGSIKSGFRVRPRSANRGLANELARLERAARSGSKARWIRAWAAVSPRCRTSCGTLPRRPSSNANLTKVGG